MYIRNVALLTRNRNRTEAKVSQQTEQPKFGSSDLIDYTQISFTLETTMAQRGADRSVRPTLISPANEWKLERHTASSLLTVESLEREREKVRG